MTDEQESRIMAAITEATTKIMDALAGSRTSTPAAPRTGLCFPNYGRAKGQPVSGASRGDLDFYAGGCRRTLDDPAKSRWHDKERDLLAAIDAEIARQSGSGGLVAPTSTGGFGEPDDLPF